MTLKLPVERQQRPNSWTYLRQKSEEFSSLLSQSPLLTDFKHPPPPPSPSTSGLKLVRIVNLKSQDCSPTSTKLYIHEFGFWTISLSPVPERVRKLRNGDVFARAVALWLTEKLTEGRGRNGVQSWILVQCPEILKTRMIMLILLTS